jgi:hypothetical protein
MNISIFNIFKISVVLTILYIILNHLMGESTMNPIEIKNLKISPYSKNTYVNHKTEHFDHFSNNNCSIHHKTEHFDHFPNNNCSIHRFSDCNKTDVVDTFMYNGEYNLLQLRFKIMIVKFRFIFICNYSFLGRNKINYIDHIPQNMAIICDDSCHFKSIIFKDGAYFNIEQCLRNQFRDKVLKKIEDKYDFENLKFIMSDLDEYVDPCELSGSFSQSILTRMYRYNINNYIHYDHKPMFMNFSDYKFLDHHELRVRNYLKFPITKPHSAFQCSSCFNNVSVYQNKVRTFAHGDPNFIGRGNDFDKKQFEINTCTQLTFEG